MKLTLLGATGSVGRELVTQALISGHTVTVLARHPDPLDERGTRVTVVQGDVTDPAVVDRAIPGADAVLSTLGHTKSSPRDLFAVALSPTITAMHLHGVRRLVVLTNTALPNAEDQPTFGQRLQGALMGFVIAQVNQDHAAQARLITDSGLDWTIVRATLLRNGPHSGPYRVGKLDGTAGSLIARANVADAHARLCDFRPLPAQHAGTESIRRRQRCQC